MNLAALAMLRDLRRSKALLSKARKGKLAVRSIKAPAKGPVRSKVLVRMNGLGEASPVSLIREAEVACRMLKSGHVKFSQKSWHPSIDAYFKASAIATNVIFTSRVHGIPIPEKVNEDMECVIAEGTEGIKRIMKVVAARSMIHHEREFHKGQGKSVRKKGAVAYMRKLMKGGRK